MESLWGKTTSFSKILAVVVFCGLPFLGFYLGTKYGEVQNELPRLELQAQQNRNNSPRYKEEPLQSIGSQTNNETSTLSDTSTTSDIHPEEVSNSWNIGINLVECKEGGARFIYFDFGSDNLVVVKKDKDTCILNYTHEVEGGYTTKECRLSTSLGSIVPAKFDFSVYCTKVIKSGNLLW